MTLKEISRYMNQEDTEWRYSTDGDKSEWIRLFNSGKAYCSVGRMSSENRTVWEIKTESVFGENRYGTTFRFSYGMMNNSSEEGKFVRHSLESVVDSMLAYRTDGKAVRLVKKIAYGATKAGYMEDMDRNLNSFAELS